MGNWKPNISGRRKLKLILEIDEVLGLNLKNAKFFAVEIPKERSKLVKNEKQARLAKDFKNQTNWRK